MRAGSPLSLSAPFVEPAIQSRLAGFVVAIAFQLLRLFLATCSQLRRTLRTAFSQEVGDLAAGTAAAETQQSKANQAP
jgi:hypothetical protein